MSKRTRLALATLVDSRVLRVLAAPIGWVLLAAAALLTWGGRAWMRRLVRKASPPADSTVLLLHAIRAAMAAGADPASALAAVGLACAPEPSLARDASRITAVALALADGVPWERAWKGAELPAVEGALRLSWERGAHAGPLLDASARAHALTRRRAMQVAAGELGVRLTLPLAFLMSAAYVLMALTEEAWLERHYGASYQEYCQRTARFIDVPELLALIERKKPSRQTS